MADIRLDRLNMRLFDRVVETGSLVLKTVGGKRKDEVAASRFLANDAINPAIILAPHIERTKSAVAGRSILVVQDTTEINFSGRAARRKGLGPAGDGVSPGFFIHPQVAVDAEHGAVLGLAGAEIWTRPEGKAADRKARGADDKESRRWLTGAETAATALDGADRIVVVGDRESDIYALFAEKPANVHLLVRATQDRALEDGASLKSISDGWRVLDTRIIEVAARRIGAAGGPRPARPARVATRGGTITIKRPLRAGNKGHVQTVTLGLVAVTEIDPPAGVEPLVWRLLTTLPVETATEAADVVRLYRLRWRVEEVFRSLKRDGLDLEASQVTTAKRLLNLAALGLVAAVRTVQLVDARDGSPRPATDVIDAADVPAVAAICKTLEGATVRQQNPHARGTLAWVAWVTARLGGWNCYYRPPGPKTMAAGWNRLADRLEGFVLAKRLEHV
jgi:Transposase DDE domain